MADVQVVPPSDEWRSPDRARSCSGASRGTSTSAAPDGSIGGFVRLGLYPNLGASLVVVPSRRSRPTARSPCSTTQRRCRRRPASSCGPRGCWADLIIETPHRPLVPRRHRGLRTGPGTTRPRRTRWCARGDRVPHRASTSSGRPTVPCTRTSPRPDTRVDARVHGAIVVGQERIALDGSGQRDHSWGVRDRWAFPGAGRPGTPTTAPAFTGRTSVSRRWMSASGMCGVMW